MTVFNTQFDLASSAAFIQRVQQAALVSALNVSAETRATPPTAQQTRRAQFAKLVLDSPSSHAPTIAQAVVAPGAITAASLDSDIQFTVNSQWDALSGEV